MVVMVGFVDGGLAVGDDELFTMDLAEDLRFLDLASAKSVRFCNLTLPDVMSSWNKYTGPRIVYE